MEKPLFDQCHRQAQYRRMCLNLQLRNRKNGIAIYGVYALMPIM
jgi:hypothetical protein